MSEMNENTTVETVVPNWDGFDVPSVVAYKAAADAKGRATVRTSVQKSHKIAAEKLSAGDATAIPEFGYWFRTLGELTVDSTKPAKDAVPAEITVAQRVATLRLAANLLANGSTLPEGIDELPEDVDLDALIANVSEESIMESAVKLAGAKITKSADRNSIQAVIERAFDGKPVGSILKISQVVKGGTLPDYKPGPGAIRARFDKESERDGFRFLDTDSNGNVARIEKIS